MLKLGYRNNARDDLFSLILKYSPRQIMEFGAYDGSTLTQLLLLHPSCKYVAIDKDEAALREIELSEIVKILDDLDQPTDSNYYEIFDFDELTVVLLLDVLEHLKCPENFMTWLAKNSSSNTIVVISIPNVRNWRTFFHLFRGEWPQNDSGLFDRTHLHFFTAKSFRNRLSFCGDFLHFEYRKSRNRYLSSVQTLAPSLLCGQMTFVIKLSYTPIPSEPVFGVRTYDQ